MNARRHPTAKSVRRQAARPGPGRGLLGICLAASLAIAPWANATGELAEPASSPAFPDDSPPLLWNATHPWADPLRIAPQQQDTPEAGWPPELAPATASPCASQAAPAPLPPQSATGLTLAQALVLALCRNAEIRVAWAETQRQSAQVGIAKAAYWPTANAAFSRLDDRNTYPGTRERGNRASLNLSWRIFDFGTRQASLQAARLQLGAALSSQNAAVLKTALQTVQAYEDAQSAWSATGILQDMHALAAQTLGSAERRERLGAGARTDTLQAQAALSRAELELSQAQGRWLEARAALAYVLGLPADGASALSLASTLDEADVARQERESQADPADGARTLGELDQWLAQARCHHPAIAAAHARWQAALAQVRAAQAEGLPSVELSAGYYDNGRPTQGMSSYGSRERIVGLTLNIPLFEGFARTYRVQDARAQAERQRVQYEDAAENSLLELARLHARAQAAWRNLRAAEALRQAAQAAQASVRRQYEQGAADVLRLTQAERELAQARLEQLKASLQWEGLRLSLLVYAQAEGFCRGGLEPEGEERLD